MAKARIQETSEKHGSLPDSHLLPLFVTFALLVTYGRVPCSLYLSFISGPKSSLKNSGPCSSVVPTMRLTLRVPITNSSLGLPVLFFNCHYHLSSISVPSSGKICSLLLATSLFIIPLPPKTFLLSFSTLLLGTLLLALTH